MKSSKKLAPEIRIYTFESEQAPDWKEAREMLFEKGKAISF
jgi:hypothetical protein